MIEDIQVLFLRFWPVIAATALVIGGYIGVKMRKSFKFSKYVDKSEDGAKVIVYLHYNYFARKKLEDVVIRDFLPETLELKGEPEDAVITENENGTTLEWRREFLKPGEKIQVSYEVSADFDVETEIELPKAELEEKDRKLKETRKITGKFGGEAT